MKHLHFATALLLTGLACGIAQAADVVVIANNANNNIDKAFVVKAYTGDTKYWPDGGALQLMDQQEGSASRSAFNSGVLGKSDSAVKAVWAQKIFTGKAVPPNLVGSDEDVKKAVAANKNAIGYIDAAAVDGTVKVLLK